MLGMKHCWTTTVTMFQPVNWFAHSTKIHQAFIASVTLFSLLIHMFFTTIASLAMLISVAHAAATCTNATGTFNPALDFQVKFVVNCAAKNVKWTVSTTADGWIGLGWNTEVGEMPGQEAVQMRLGATGAAEARNVFALDDDSNPFDTQALTELSGSKTNGTFTFSFTKALDGAQNHSIAIAPGVPLSFNVAKHKTSSDWTKEHTDKANTAQKVDIFSLTAGTTGAATSAKTPSTTAANDAAAAIGTSSATLLVVIVMTMVIY
jgi:hypothetical protein